MENPNDEPESFSDNFYKICAKEKEFKFWIPEGLIEFCYDDFLMAMVVAYLLFHTKRTGKPDKIFKFIEPCKNKYYRNGDSWCELTKSKKDKMKDFLQKITKTLSSEDQVVEHNKLIERFQIGGKMYYRINDKNFLRRLNDYLIERNEKENEKKINFTQETNIK